MSPNVQAWMAVLAKMEADVVSVMGKVTAVGIQGQDPQAERVQVEEAGATAAWTPPRGLGPLPAELVERARDVEAAQRTAVERLEEAKATTARHLAAIQSVREAKANGHAVFLDVTS